MYRAIKRNDLQTVIKYHNKGLWTPNAIDVAAAHGHLEIVKWLHEHSVEGYTTNAMDLAASNGYLEIVKWLHEHRIIGCIYRAIDSAHKMAI